MEKLFYETVPKKSVNCPQRWNTNCQTWSLTCNYFLECTHLAKKKMQKRTSSCSMETIHCHCLWLKKTWCIHKKIWISKFFKPLATQHPQNTPDLNVKIFDGASLVHQLDAKTDTSYVKMFKDYAEGVFSEVFQ